MCDVSSQITWDYDHVPQVDMSFGTQPIRCRGGCGQIVWGERLGPMPRPLYCFHCSYKRFIMDREKIERKRKQFLRGSEMLTGTCGTISIGNPPVQFATVKAWSFRDHVPNRRDQREIHRLWVRWRILNKRSQNVRQRGEAYRKLIRDREHAMRKLCAVVARHPRGSITSTILFGETIRRV